MENTQSGYTPCACRDCMDTTASWDADTPSRCSLCWEAGCEPYAPDSADYNALPGHMRECQRDDAYGVEDDREARESAREVIAAVDAFGEC